MVSIPNGTRTVWYQPCRVSAHHLHSPPARPPDPNPYTRYWVLQSKFTQALLALLLRRQENTALLSSCGLTGDATTRFPC